jgi:hypothetical protein
MGLFETCLLALLVHIGSAQQLPANYTALSCVWASEGCRNPKTYPVCCAVEVAVSNSPGRIYGIGYVIHATIGELVCYDAVNSTAGIPFASAPSHVPVYFPDRGLGFSQGLTCTFYSENGSRDNAGILSVGAVYWLSN